MSAYALREKVVRILPRRGVAIAFRDFDPHRGFHDVPALRNWEELPYGGGRCSADCQLVWYHIQPHTPGYRDHSRDVRSYLLDRIDLDINGECSPC